MKKGKKIELVLENLWAGEERPKGIAAGGLMLKLLLILVVAFLLSRAFFLQVVIGRHNQVLAEGNRIEARLVSAERGVIKDRFGEVLARNSLDKNKAVVREYPFGESAAHLIGYIGEVTEADMASCGKEDKCDITPGDVAGKVGVERLFEKELRGRKSEELVEMNAAGEVVRVIGQKEGMSGKTLSLTIDGELQKTIGRVLADYEAERGIKIKGAVVVSKVENGEILAMTSWPSFDNNAFTVDLSEGRTVDLERILSDYENKPMFNRAIGGAFPPGSVFKLLTATAGLEEGKIDESTTVEDVGELKVGIYRYGTWNFDQNGRTEGVLGITRALARSNDIFFYKVGEWVGVEKLAEWSRKLGLGQRSGLNWPGEAAGLVPDPLEKERRTGERWFLGNTYHMAIGQGDILLSPMQVNRLTASVVSGRLCDWKLNAEAEASCRELSLKPQTRELVYQGMSGACARGGTGFTFFNFEPAVICKTGTAQHGGEETMPHAWISVIVPKAQGRDRAAFEQGVVITVLLEEAGEGSAEAGWVAEKVAKFVAQKGY